MSVTHWQCGRFVLDLHKTVVMGVVNITPDSFSDGGRYASTDQAIAQAHRLIEEGAQIIDLGAESTRPGATPVNDAQELARILPVMEALRDSGVVLSVDTSKPNVMRNVLQMGADLINDISGLRHPEARAIVAGHKTCGVCVMHMQGTPATMQISPQYGDVVADVFDELRSTARSLQADGIAADRISLDPGFGFGKSVHHNLTLMRHLSELVASGYPVTVGVSRKSMLGAITGRSVDQRLVGSVAAMLALVARGAQIVRVHDVQETVDALRVWDAVNFGWKQEESIP